MAQRVEDLCQTAYESIAEAMDQLDAGSAVFRRLAEAKLKIEDAVSEHTGHDQVRVRDWFNRN